MREFYFDRDGVTYKRVNKKAALHALDNGKSLLIMPCKVNPVSIWYASVFPVTMGYLDKLYRRYRIETNKQIFERYCNEYAAYNCYSETGSYLSYYMAI